MKTTLDKTNEMPLIQKRLAETMMMLLGTTIEEEVRLSMQSLPTTTSRRGELLSDQLLAAFQRHISHNAQLYSFASVFASDLVPRGAVNKT